MVLGRQDGGSYQLVIVSYARRRKTDPATDTYPTVEAINTTVTTIADWGTDESELQGIPTSPINYQKFFKLGGRFLTSNGRFARITAFNGNNPIVKPRLPTGAMNVWTVAQIINSSGAVGENPVMSVMVMRTGLQE